MPIVFIVIDSCCLIFTYYPDKVLSFGRTTNGWIWIAILVRNSVPGRQLNRS